MESKEQEDQTSCTQKKDRYTVKLQTSHDTKQKTRHQYLNLEKN